MTDRNITGLIAALTEVRANDFLATEFGGEFDKSTLKISDNGENFTVQVETSFTINNRRFAKGETVHFNNFAEMTTD